MARSDLANRYFSAFIQAHTPQLVGAFSEINPSISPYQFPLLSSIGELPHPKELLKRVHYSWIAEYLKQYSQEDIITLASLFPESFDKIMRLLEINGEKRILTEDLERYFFHFLHKKIESSSDDYLPFPLLPPSPLIDLTLLSRKQLLELINYLGLHDLAIDIKKMVHAHQVRALKEMLSEEERIYLSQILREKEKLVFRSIELAQWDGNRELLRKVLHERGLNRLAKGLAGAPSSIQWHIIHTLDIGRGRIVAKHATPIPQLEAYEHLQKRILSLIHLIRSRESL